MTRRTAQQVRKTFSGNRRSKHPTPSQPPMAGLQFKGTGTAAVAKSDLVKPELTQPGASEMPYLHGGLEIQAVRPSRANFRAKQHIFTRRQFECREPPDSIEIRSADRQVARWQEIAWTTRTHWMKVHELHQIVDDRNGVPGIALQYRSAHRTMPGLEGGIQGRYPVGLSDAVRIDEGEESSVRLFRPKIPRLAGQQACLASNQAHTCMCGDDRRNTIVRRGVDNDDLDEDRGTLIVK